MASARSRIVLLALAALAALFAAAADLAAGERYALVIGVHQYDKNQLRSLPFAETDAVAVADKLKAIGFRRVVLMTQSAGAKEARFLPTAANVRDAIDGFLDPRKWDEEDTAVIVLSGHGVQFRGQDVSYFCPMDTRLEKPDTLVEIQEIYRKLEKCPAAFKLLIADCCRNDPQSDFSRARAEVNLDSVTRPQRLKPPGGVAAFFSCSAGEKAFESPDLKKGVFTHFLLEALSEPKADLDRDGKVDLDELVRFTKRNVTDYVSDQFGERTIQVPEMVGKTRGLVPLVELAKLTPVKPVTPPLVPGLTSSKAMPVDSPKPGDLKTITSKTTGMKLVLVPNGEYERGSPTSDKDAENDEKPQHRVRITNNFYLGQFEVTQGEWLTVMETEPWKGQTFSKQGKDYAATYVSWTDAQAFCQKLSQRDGATYRLPTEAEWEFACRAGTKTRFSLEDESKLDEYAWYDKNAFNIGEKYAPSVGQKKPNPFGLYDMHGGVWEWCHDEYDGAEYEQFASKIAVNPTRIRGVPYYRVLRGGSWNFNAWNARSADRLKNAAGDRNSYFGFRILRPL